MTDNDDESQYKSSSLNFEFLLFDVHVRSFKGKDTIILVGKKENEKVILFDPYFFNYFYIIYDPNSDPDVLKKKLIRFSVKDKNGSHEIIKVQEKIRKYKGKNVSVLKVFVNSGINSIVKEIKNLHNVLFVLEDDIKLDEKYLLYYDLCSFFNLNVDVNDEGVESSVSRYKLRKINSVHDFSTSEIDLHVSVIDIETYNPPLKGISPDENPVLMISLYSKSKEFGEYKQVFTWQSQDNFDTEVYKDTFRKKFSNTDEGINFSEENISFYYSEEDCFRGFLNELHRINPDIIVGYNSDQFDMWYLQERSKKIGFSFQAGIDFSEISLSRGNRTSASIFGFIHIDLYKVIKRLIAPQLKTKSYSLNAVSNELLGSQKHGVAIEKLYSSWDSLDYDLLSDFCYYNFRDSYLTYELYKLIEPNILELLSILGGTYFSVSRMSYSKMVEYYLMSQAISLHELIPNKPDYKQIADRRGVSYQGAFVYQPSPKLYEDVAIFDFRSLYPSLIISYNISPETFGQGVSDENKKIINRDDGPVWFSQNPIGFIPRQLKEIIERRIRIKDILSVSKDKKEIIILDAKQYSLKILLNSVYGYLGFFAARWYSLECVKSVTSLGRESIQNIISSLNDSSYEVIYSDTDSVFVQVPKPELVSLQEKISVLNGDLPGIMHLSFEEFYNSVIFVSTKGDTGGAKKKYAALKESGDLVIKGFETVRRNWCLFAKNLQRELISLILKEKDFKKGLKLVQERISLLKSYDVSMEDLKISTMLTKSLSEYSVVTPSVAAAKLVENKGFTVKSGTLVNYIISKSISGAQVRDKVILFEDATSGDYDINYYLNHQLIPAVEQILALGNITKDEIISLDSSQQSLGDWA